MHESRRRGRSRWRLFQSQPNTDDLQFSELLDVAENVLAIVDHLGSLSESLSPNAHAQVIGVTANSDVLHN